MTEPKRRPWICIAGLHNWIYRFYTAGMHVWRCDRCDAEKTERLR